MNTYNIILYNELRPTVSITIPTKSFKTSLINVRTYTSIKLKCLTFCKLLEAELVFAQ